MHLKNGVVLLALMSFAGCGSPFPQNHDTQQSRPRTSYNVADKLCHEKHGGKHPHTSTVNSCIASYRGISSETQAIGEEKMIQRNSRAIDRCMARVNVSPRRPIRELVPLKPREYIPESKLNAFYECIRPQRPAQQTVVVQTAVSIGPVASISGSGRPDGSSFVSCTNGQRYRVGNLGQRWVIQPVPRQYFDTAGLSLQSLAQKMCS